MKLAIICNFAPFPSHGGSFGGSEEVIRHISLGLSTEKYGWTVDIYGHNYKKPSKCDGINLFPCPRGNALIPLISNHYDHIFIYSDSQWNFDHILQNIKIIDCRLSLAFVGAYHTRDHSPTALQLLKDNIDKFTLITHSKYQDYQFCVDNNLPVTIIPNGVDLSEFAENNINFREKYNIKEKHIILNVSNYFFGKNQQYIGDIARQLEKYISDFKIVQISNSIKYPYEKLFRDRTTKNCKDINTLFLRDLPREDVISAFLSSDVFLFPSLKEVSPIVILESRAAKLPWVSFNVGDISEQAGGIPVAYKDVDEKGYVIVNSGHISHFAQSIYYLLSKYNVRGREIDRRKQVIKEGQKDIEQKDWKNIVPLYHKVFSE